MVPNRHGWWNRVLRNNSNTSDLTLGHKSYRWVDDDDILSPENDGEHSSPSERQSYTIEMTYIFMRYIYRADTERSTKCMTNYYHERRDYLNGEGKNHRIHRQNREPTTYSIDGGVY